VVPEVLTVFRSRLAEGVDVEYGPLAQRMVALATAMPGIVSVKSYQATDGERATIVVFADRASHEAWRRHPEHREAQAAGRDRLYEWYHLHVADVTAEHEFASSSGQSPT
jgi:heme-degrading monooxygenase HmoA